MLCRSADCLATDIRGKFLWEIQIHLVLFQCLLDDKGDETPSGSRHQLKAVVFSAPAKCSNKPGLVPNLAAGPD
jgi:hypothetical protein